MTIAKPTDDEMKNLNEFNKNRNVLHVVFPELPERFDMYVDKWSTDIARSGTFTAEEYNWKNWIYQQAHKLAVKEKIFKKDAKNNQQGYVMETVYKDKAFVVQVFMDNKWWDATIIEIIEENRTEKHGRRPFLLAKIGYRVYCDPAYSIKRDSQQRYFVGFGEARDEMIPLYSPRISALPAKRWIHYEKMKADHREDVANKL